MCFQITDSPNKAVLKLKKKILCLCYNKEKNLFIEDNGEYFKIGSVKNISLLDAMQNKQKNKTKIIMTY